MRLHALPPLLLLLLLLLPFHAALALGPGTAGTVQGVGAALDAQLGEVRARLIGLWAELGVLPDGLAACWAQLKAQMPGADVPALLLYVLAFIAGGIASQRLFRLASRHWLMHFGTADRGSLRHRLALVSERLAYGLLMLGFFAAGSMGTFLLFRWPPLSGAVILGFLWASLLWRLAALGTRFFLAPGAPRLRLLPMPNANAWFWHYWIIGLTAAAALGRQVIQLLAGLGLSAEGIDLLDQILLLALGLGACVIACTRPGPEPEGGDAPADRPRGAAMRVLFCVGIALLWLLFLLGAGEVALSVVVLGFALAAVGVLRTATATVIRGTETEPSEEIAAVAAIAKRMVQTLVAVIAIYALAVIWQVDPSAMTADGAMARMGQGTFEALLILIGADLLWQIVRVLIDRRLSGETPGLIDALDGEGLRRRARVRTLLPVLRNFLFFIVIIMASLSALAAIGLQIGPLLAGAGVVGVAVGFGAQTLVRDVLSGVFFLLDDAFRVGELIESGPISGTVESFSLRSVRLRHYKGHLHTVPFGDLKSVTNYSRDWTNELMEVVVTYDTDLDRLEQVAAEVSRALGEDEALAARIIEPLVCLGVTAMGDTGMKVGFMVKTRPGEQFAVRRVVFSRLKAAFAEAGIRFASWIPPAPGLAEPERPLTG